MNLFHRKKNTLVYKKILQFFIIAIISSVSANSLVAEEIQVKFKRAGFTYMGLALWSGTATINWNDGSPIETFAAADTNSTATWCSNIKFKGIRHRYAGSQDRTVTINFSNGLSAAKYLSFSRQSNTKLSEFTNLTELQYLSLAGVTPADLTGNVSSLPKNLDCFISSTNKLSGNISLLSDKLKVFTVRGRNNLSGDISLLPKQLSLFSLGGYNTVSGDLAKLPKGLKTLIVAGIGVTDVPGANTISGDIADLPRSVTDVRIGGHNTISGNVANIPAKVVKFELAGNNTISGDISDIPGTLSSFSLLGKNTMTGDISQIPKNFLGITIGGNNTITGNVASIPAHIRNLHLHGNNTVTGNVALIPTQMSSLTLNGKNTIYGDLGQMKINNIFRFRIGGLNTIDQFSAPSLWEPTRLQSFKLTGGGATAFDANEVDRALILLAEKMRNADFTDREFSLRRRHDAAPTAAANAAISALKAKGYTVFVN